MKKLVLVAAIAAAMPVLAQADVTIYGSVRAGIDSLKYNGQTTTGVDDYNSRIGFKGSEDLGNGLKAVWQVENGFAVDGVASKSGSGTGTLANRTSFVGLEGSFGKVTLGNQLDIFSETEATDNLYGPRRDSMGIPFPLYEGTDVFGTYGDGFTKNGIRYDSPDLNGFTAIVEYGAGEGHSTTTGKQTGNNFGARLAYTNSGFFGAYANMTQLNVLGSDKNSSVHRVEFGYDANNLYLAATVQKATLYGDASTAVTNYASFGIADTGLNKLTSHSWAINAAYTIGAFKPSFVYSKRSGVKVDGQSQDWGASQWAAAVDYSLSKRTMVQAGYGQVKENDGAASALGMSDAKTTLTWLMLKHNF
ncbi:porin [Aquitalea palustris]|uniref:Porin n=1 Tax=Aquitalea palustris TaxID=2480983 RepID=A0A454JME2_9NEIS|nr:porin [Aquitalea palustris]RMD01164.1 porin [Aquitalea palustris]